MVEFLKYCFYCFCGFVSGAFGNTTDGMTLKDYIIGCFLLLLLIPLGYLMLRFLFWLIDGPIDRLIRQLASVKKQ